MEEDSGLPANAGPRFGNNDVLRHTILPYCLLGFLVALLAPEESSKYPTIAAVISGVSSCIPGIDHLANATASPGATRVFLAVMWIFFPLVVAIATPQVDLACVPRLHLLRRSDQWFLVGTGVAISLFSLMMIAFFPAITMAEAVSQGGRGGWLMIALTQSRIGLALIGPLFFCIAATWSAATIKLAYLVSQTERTR